MAKGRRRTVFDWQLPDSSEASDPGAQLARHAPAAFTTLLDAEGDLGPQLTSFLNTSAGLQWLSGCLDTWETWLVKAASAGHRPPSVLDLNKLILTKFRDFLNSDEARKVASQLEQEMQSGALMVPVYVVEELIKHRLRAMVKVHLDKNKFYYLRFFSWRMALSTCLLALARRATLKLSARMGPKWHDAARFVTDVLLPPAVWGPALGMLLGVGQMAYMQEEGLLSSLPSSGAPAGKRTRALSGMGTEAAATAP